MEHDKCNELIGKVLDFIQKITIAERSPISFSATCRLFPSEIHMIDAIGRHAGSNIVYIAGKLGVTKGAVSQIVSKLVKRGMVSKEKAKGNGKEVSLFLTEAGKKSFKAHMDFHSKVNEPILKELMSLSGDEIDLLTRILERINSQVSIVMKENVHGIKKV